MYWSPNTEKIQGIKEILSLSFESHIICKEKQIQNNWIFAKANWGNEFQGNFLN